jgi:hypothetical protein
MGTRTREIIRRGKIKSEKCTLKTDGSGIDKINIINNVLDAFEVIEQSSKMIDKNRT